MGKLFRHIRGVFNVTGILDRQHFKNPDVPVPSAGIGLDIDSNQHGVAIKDADDLVEAVGRVCALSKAIEEAIVNHLGCVDE